LTSVSQKRSDDRKLILVTGATGKQGGAVAKSLPARGLRVRVLVRDAAKPAAQALAQAGAELAVGDLGNAESLRRALAGTQGVFTYGVYSAQAAHEAGGGEVTGEVRQGQLLADLAAEAGIEHFVYGSVGSADRSTGVPHFDSKFEVEKHIARLGLPATILRPVFFMQNWERMRAQIMSGTLAQPLTPTTRHKQISVADIGAFAAAVFAAPERWIGHAVDLAGDALTMEETAAAMSRVIGREVRYVQMPWDQFEARLGRESTLMFRFFESPGFVADPAVLRAEVPEPHTLERYLRAAGWGGGA
jgi:uncharacterized protein YbjT (DUF2867 family)